MYCAIKAFSGRSVMNETVGEVRRLKDISS